MQEHDAMDDQSRPSGNSMLPMRWRVGVGLLYAFASVPVLVQSERIGELYFGWRIAPYWHDLFGCVVNAEMVLLLLLVFAGSVLFLIYGHRLPWRSRLLLWIARILSGFLVLLLLFEFIFTAVNGHPANLTQVLRDL